MIKSISNIFPERTKLPYILIGCFMALMILQSCSDNKRELKLSNDQRIIPDSLSWAEKMAESELYRRKNSLEFGKSNPKVKWNYQTGLFLKAILDMYKSTGHKEYFEYAKIVIDSYLDDDGSIKTYKIKDYNIDNINSGKVLVTLFNETNNHKYKQAADILRQQLQEHPRTKSGGFWHKNRYPWQMWLGGIYMGAPFYAEYSIIFNEPGGIEDAINQILLVDVRTRDPQTGVRYHGWDESNKQRWADPENGCSPNFWGRAIGWYGMALVDILDFIPEDHRKRNEVIFILNDLCKALVKYQDAETGLWYQVVDKTERNDNYLEASASCMYVYTFVKGEKKGYLDSSYMSLAQKAYDGIINNFVVTESNGLISLTDICSVAGLGGKPYRDGSYEYYLSEPIVKNDLKGVGPFIMASLQMDQ